MHAILLVEDDVEIVNLLSLHLDETKYHLTTAGTIGQARKALEQQDYELVILDISLPDGNGIDLCKQIRKSNQTAAVMMLTCHSEESEKVLALEQGADDYVLKPFGILELLARVKAILRRAGVKAVGNETPATSTHFRELSIDLDKRKVSLGGKRLDLTVKEFDLLWHLAANPGKTFSRKELLERVWGFSFEEYEHTVTSHINRLRIKLEPELSRPTYILTAWGTGYRFAE